MARTPRTTTNDPDIRLLSALADPTRLAIVRELAESNETCACDFTAACDVGQPTVSHHLRVLREAGVVTSERRGQWIYYRLAPDVAVRLATIARGMIPGGLIPVSDLVTRRRSATRDQRTRPSALRSERVGRDQPAQGPADRPGAADRIRSARTRPCASGRSRASHSSARSSLKSGS